MLKFLRHISDRQCHVDVGFHLAIEFTCNIYVFILQYINNCPPVDIYDYRRVVSASPPSWFTSCIIQDRRTVCVLCIRISCSRHFTEVLSPSYYDSLKLQWTTKSVHFSCKIIGCVAVLVAYWIDFHHLSDEGSDRDENNKKVFWRCAALSMLIQFSLFKCVVELKRLQQDSALWLFKCSTAAALTLKFFFSSLYCNVIIVRNGTKTDYIAIASRRKDPFIRYI